MFYKLEKNCKMRLLNCLFVGVIFLGYLVVTPTIADNPTISSHNIVGIQTTTTTTISNNPIISSHNIGIKLIVSYGAYVKLGNDTLKVSQLLNLHISRVNQIFGNTNLNGKDPMNIFKFINLVPCEIVIHDYPNIANNNLNEYNEDGVTWEYESIISNLTDYLSDSVYPMVILFTNNDIQKKSGQKVFGFSAIGQFNSEYNFVIGQYKSKYNFAIISLFAFDPHQMAVSLVVAHEVGHLLGAEHDQSHENRSDCNPPTIADAYIMSGIQNFRYGPNYMKFSSCSIEDIIGNKNNFFGQDCVEKTKCGNKFVDQGEECDDSGPCCNAVSCRLKPGKKCSHWHSTCCDSNCQVLPKGQPCLPADLESCFDVSRCDGISPQCPYYQNPLTYGYSCHDSKLDKICPIQTTTKTTTSTTTPPPPPLTQLSIPQPTQLSIPQPTLQPTQPTQQLPKPTLQPTQPTQPPKDTILLRIYNFFHSKSPNSQSQNKFSVSLLISTIVFFIFYLNIALL